MKTIRMCLIVALVFVASNAHAAIGYDTSAVAGSFVASSLTLSVPITIGSGSNRAAIVWLDQQVFSTAPTSVVCCGGQTFTKIFDRGFYAAGIGVGDTQACTSSGTDEAVLFNGTEQWKRVTGWQLVAPTSGATNVVITFPSSTSALAGALSLTGVDQTTPVETAIREGCVETTWHKPSGGLAPATFGDLQGLVYNGVTAEAILFVSFFDTGNTILVAPRPGDIIAWNLTDSSLAGGVGVLRLNPTFRSGITPLYSLDSALGGFRHLDAFTNVIVIRTAGVTYGQ